MIRLAKTFVILLGSTFLAATAGAQTPGSVAFNTTLVSVNGKWGTKHYVVAWVTKEDGTFIKTLWKQGKTSWTSSEWTTNCPSWNTARGGSSGSTAFDGYTSATAADYSTPVNNPIDPVWNCLDAAGALVPDGNYKFWVQYGHSDAAGPVTTNGLLWTKRSSAFSASFPNTSSFTGMSIAWTPSAVPEIAVEQPAGTNLTDGSATVSFGSINLGSSSSAVTFTVKNTGTGSLTGLGLTKDGANAGDFTVSSVASSVAAGGSTTFTVVFTPGGAGTRTAAIHLVSNDANESPFDINLTGSGENLVFTPGTATLAATLGPVGGGGYWWVAWVTRNDGTFIKTLRVVGNSAGGPWDGDWGFHCGTWDAARNGSMALDGYTAATASSYAPPDNPIAVTWNGRDAANNVMPDGTYKLWIQYSEDDDSAPGPVTTNGLTWTKGASATTANPPAQGASFTNLAITWTPVTAFGLWATGAGLGETADPTATPHQDGVNHLQKFAFNLDPTRADARRLVVGAGGTAGLPGTAVTPGPVLQMEFIRRKAATLPGITYTAQFGSDFTGWTTVTGPAVSIDEIWERVVVVDTPPAGSTKRFGRVKVTQP
jgi:hypothetical protein